MKTEALRTRALRLAAFIVVWDVIEGVVAISAGVAAGSIALIGFGMDSGIEVFAASVVIWQLRGGAHSRQRTSLRLLAITFFVLALFVSVEAARDLVSGDEASESTVGIALSAVALVVMVPVAVAQRRTGDAMSNETLISQSKETWLSNYLSVALLVGLGLNAALGWWWADPVAAIGVAVLAVGSGRDAWLEAREAPSSDRDR